MQALLTIACLRLCVCASELESSFALFLFVNTFVKSLYTTESRFIGRWVLFLRYFFWCEFVLLLGFFNKFVWNKFLNIWLKSPVSLYCRKLPVSLITSIDKPFSPTALPLLISFNAFLISLVSTHGTSMSIISILESLFCLSLILYNFQLNFSATLITSSLLIVI